MARDEGFAVAAIATAKLTDPKFRALWRNLRPDESAMALACQLYEAVQLSSWQHGERVTAEDAAPFWMSDPAPHAEALQGAGLLDREHRIPRRPWQTWFGEAVSRREKMRDRWRRYNENRPRGANASDDAEPTRLPRGSDADTASSVRPSGSTDRPSDPSGVAHVAALEEVTLLPINRIEDKTRREFDRLADQRGSEKVASAIRDVAERIPTQPPAARQVMVEVLRALEPFAKNGTTPHQKGMSNRSDLEAATEVV
jgi:hypothetical protein